MGTLYKKKYILYNCRVLAYFYIYHLRSSIVFGPYSFLSCLFKPIFHVAEAEPLLVTSPMSLEGHGECSDASGAGGGDPVQAGARTTRGYQADVVEQAQGKHRKPQRRLKM